MTTMSGPVTDAQLQAVLGRFAALADVLLRDTPAWLADDEPAGPGPGGEASRGIGRRALHGLGLAAVRARRLLVGREHPGSRGWAALPVGRRTGWWVTRIRTVAAPIAATPRVAGVLADRLPLQGALGAAAAGLAVCAVAREHGVDVPQDWVPLLGRVLFDRDLARPGDLPDAGEAARAADAASPLDDATPSAPAGAWRRIGRGIWRLALLLWGLPGLFDERPRGNLVWRALGKLPVVGLAAGLLDERGAVAAAADETRRLLRARPAAPA